MRGIQFRSSGGLDNLALVDLADPGEPGPGEIRVRLHASSLNCRDLVVVTREGWQADGRIPMAEGAGVASAKRWPNARVPSVTSH